MVCYAQLNADGICIGISRLSGEVIHPSLVRINNFDEDYLWRKYEDDRWSEEKYEPRITY